MKRVMFGCVAAALLALGCRSISVHKHDPVVYVPPGQTNVVCIVEGGWDASYYSYGVWTSFGSLGVTIGTNVVSLALNDLNSDVSTNHTQIIVAGGEAAGEIAEAIINGLKKIP
jgi:hypothetical protein